MDLASKNPTGGPNCDARSLKRDLQKPIEHELERLGCFLTHRVSPILAGFLVRNPSKSRRDDYSDAQKYHSQIGNPG